MANIEVIIHGRSHPCLVEDVRLEKGWIDLPREAHRPCTYFKVSLTGAPHKGQKGEEYSVALKIDFETLQEMVNALTGELATAR
jgi:hypothetical protein